MSRALAVLACVLWVVGLLTAPSFLLIAYLGLFGVLAFDPWADVAVLNLLTGALLIFLGFAAGELSDGF
ncbi:hypothetical protein [Nocardioides massiliensis]|uniref:Membrane protein n=1 Tax=Nocardioides massiliensis TaxID=1325935 RepID=A0ABT9NJU1_9ACTN|nr:hypothetical protein [Nocardioides massiliensis]MDP9820502.1 putative membrane protein [Nocardioides massiliensis]